MRGKFLQVDHAPALAKKFCNTNADMQSVCSSAPCWDRI